MNQLIVNKFAQNDFTNSNFFLRTNNLNSFLLDLSRTRGLMECLEHQQNPLDQLLDYFNIQNNAVNPNDHLNNLMINMNDNEKNTLKAVLNYFIFMYMDRAMGTFRLLPRNRFPPNLLIFEINYYSIYNNLVRNCDVNELSENTVIIALDFLHQYISGIVE